MNHDERQRFSSLRMDVDTVLKPFDDERRYLQLLRKSSNIEPILLHLFDLLKAEDYRVLFASLNREKFDSRWLEVFSRLCMKRYLENDSIVFHEKLSPNSIKSQSYSKSILENYTNYLIENFQRCYTLHHFHTIIAEFEQLNRFKIEQISRQLNKNNQLIQKLFLLFNNDDSIIHLSSTPAQPIYQIYKPTHMIYVGTNVWIKDNQEPCTIAKGITKTFVADLIHTKRIEILDDIRHQTHLIYTKSIYFAQPCEMNVILPLKLRVLIVDDQTNQPRSGIIGEEAGRNNHFRSLIFFPDEKCQITANYYPSSDIHICFDQTFENDNDFLVNYFKSYPERFMLRAKEGTMVKIRHSTNNTFLSALIIQIDCSMMLIEFMHSKERLWIYRGSTLIEQMNNYYSTQNRSTRHSARQHLSAKKSNAPEIICFNDQMKTKLSRIVEQNNEESRTIKRVRASPNKSSRSNQSNDNSTDHIITSLQTRSNHTNANSKVIINPLFLELAASFLLHHSNDLFPHHCSNKCVQHAERYLMQLPRTTNPYLKPLACQWTILETIRIKKAGDIRVKNTRPILIYCSPCGKKLFNETQVDNYLYETKSKLTVELFVFDSAVNIRQSYCSDGKILSKDISNGQENVPIIAVNEVDDDQPQPFTYRMERTPVEGVNVVTNGPNMTCCSCTDGCRNRTQCACWLRTLKYAELIGDDRVKSMKAKNKSQAEILYQLGYGFRRLHKNVPGGIYECNSKCACNKQTCSNRLVQNGITVQLQLFKTIGRGWGVRTLHDIPLGTFISVYSGEIFTSEQADERGKLIGDEYQADLDFFENINDDSNEEGNANESEDEENQIPSDGDESTHPRLRTLRSRETAKKNSSKESTRMNKNQNSTLNRTLLPDYDGVVYTLDAKLIGNVGRYFNHSCSPNIAVQNVFVDTHDIHFPWIGFFTTKTVRAGTELCWDYNYTVGEIAGRRMDCNCGSSECRRRVL